MSVLLWIAGTLGSLVAVALLILVVTLTSLIRIEGRVAAEGVWARGRWGLLRFDVRPTENRLTLHVLGVRVVRTTMSRNAGERGDTLPDDAPLDETKLDDTELTPARGVQETKKGRRPAVRLSFASYRRLARTAWRELRHMLHHLHVDRLRLEAVVASPDPVLTGEVYGAGCAATSVMRSVWPHADVHWGVDFEASEPRAAGELVVRLRPIRLLPSVMRIGSTYWRERRESRRRA